MAQRRTPGTPYGCARAARVLTFAHDHIGNWCGRFFAFASSSPLAVCAPTGDAYRGERAEQAGDKTMSIKVGSKVRVAKPYGNLAPGPFGLSGGRVQSWGVSEVFSDGIARIHYGNATAHCPIDCLELVTG